MITSMMRPLRRSASRSLRASELDGLDVEVSVLGPLEEIDPLGADGEPRADGIREFVVGTGGKSLRPFDAPKDTTKPR